MNVSSIAAAWTSGESVGKMLAGALVGAVAMFFALGSCNKEPRASGGLAGVPVIENTPDTVARVDTVKELYPVPTGDGSFSFVVNTESGMFSAESASPLPLKNLLFPTRTIYDTVTHTEYAYLPEVKSVLLEHNVRAGISPLFDKAFLVGWSTSATYDKLTLDIRPELILRPDGLPTIQPFVFVEVNYRL